MERFRFLLISGVLLFLTGCALLPHHKHDAAVPASQPIRAKGGWYLSLRFPFLHHTQPPPRAQALQRVGVIRTLSGDGSFVIIELEPGVLIPPGRDLVVTAGAGEPARLRAAENQPPYFIADIKSGHPLPGQIVFQ
jgi:hypothetical protein